MKFNNGLISGGSLYFLTIVLSIMFLVSGVSATDYTLNPGDSGGINSVIATINSNGQSDDTLTLNEGIYNKDSDIRNNISFSVSKNLLIQGNGTATIDARGSGNIFTIGSSMDMNNITFKNLIFINAHDNIGGAIYNSGDLTVINCSFTGNTASNYYGGAIYSSGNLTVINCSFTGNTASYSDGGAIMNTGNSTVINCSFTGNNASNFGGAIYNNDYANFSVSDSVFTNNTVVNGGGGAISNRGNFIISNSVFTNNTASYGGAILNSVSLNFSLSNSSFTGNNVIYIGCAIYNTADNFSVSDSVFAGNYGGDSGGAIFNAGINFSVNNSSFTDNNVRWHGGAIFNTGINFSVNNSSFTGNNASNFGGAIYNEADGVNSRVNGSIFTANKAIITGGAIYNQFGVNCSVSNSSFIDNNASYAGAIYNQFGVNCSVNNSVFTGNNAINYGGAIYTNRSSNFSVSGSSFIGNNASYAGVIYNYYSNNSTVNNSSFIGNNASYYGGVIYNHYANNSTVNNSSFIGNNASYYGGVIYNYYSNNLTVNNSSFIGNNASYYGGAIYSYGLNLTVSNSNFSNNNVTYYGGAIYNINSNLRIILSNFSNNSATYGAGAVYNGASNFNVTLSNFTSNNARSGGAIMNSASNVVINQSDFVGNYALDAVITTYGSNIKINYNRFFNPSEGLMDYDYDNNNNFDYNWWGENNIPSTVVANNYFIASANINGSNIKYTFTLNNSDSYDISLLPNFTGYKYINDVLNSEFNPKVNGSFSYSGDNTTLIVDYWLFTTKDLLGIVYVNQTGGNDENNGSNWNNAVATLKQALIILKEGGKIIIAPEGSYTGINNTNLTINKNLSIQGFGNVILDGENTYHLFDISNVAVNFTNISFINFNNYDYYGGAIYSMGQLTFTNSSFVNNTANSAGAIRINGKNIFNNVTFTNNSAINIAGAIYSSNTIFINNSIFNNNHANDAGAIYLDNSYDNKTILYIQDSTFNNNYANSTGAIYTTSFNLTVINSSFLNNSALEGNTGAIDISHYDGDSTSLIKDSNFINNTAYYSYGAVYMDVHNASIINSTFLNNSALNGGTGAFYYENGNDGSILIIEDSTFDNNYARWGNVAGYVQGNNVIVINSSFVNNLADDGSTGAMYFELYNDNSNLTINNSVFINNSASSYGAVYIYGNNVNITNTSFINNTADNGYYGALYMEYNYDTAILNIIDSTFINNSATYGYSALYTNFPNVTINNTNFTNNQALNGYYTVYYDNGNDGSILIIEDSIFNNNYAKWGYGVAYVYGNNVFVINSSFINNLADEGDAGALYFDFGNENSNLTIIDSVFINNSARSYGAVYIYGNNANITNTKFINNTAITGDAGALCYAYSYDESILIINNSTFIDNSAYYNGGALYLWAYDIHINNSEFSNNTAFNDSGDGAGAIYLHVENNSVISNSNFTSNTAYNNGGALYIDNSGLISIYDSNFTNNSAVGYYGGAIYNTADNLIVNNSNFIGNNASTAGGIYTSGEYTTIIQLNFTLNDQPIYFDGNNGVLYRSNVFNNNLAIIINNGASDTNISYSRIFNNTNKKESDIDINSSTFDLEDNGINSILDYNWWGDNTLSIMANGAPFTPDKYFVVGITNISIVGHNSIALFNYTFGLNDNSSANATLLPYFVTDVWTNITTTGSVEVFNLLSFNPTGLTHISNFDARENKIIAVTLNLTNTQEVEFTFVTDNEANKIDLLIYNNSGENITVNGENGTYHTNITINATLSNLTGPMSNKTVNFYIDIDGDFNGSGTADLIFIGTGTTDANGFTSITYLINYTGNYSIFTIAFDDDNTTILTFNTTNLTFYPQNATITTYNNTTTVGVYPTLIANVTGQLDGQLDGVTVNFIVNGNIVGTSITNSSGIAIFTYTGTDFTYNFTYSAELDNGNYSCLNSTAEIFINKANININITTPNANVGQIINITLNLTNLANSSYPINGLFNVSVGGVNYTNVNFINGLANISYQVTAVSNSLNISVSGNDYYNPNNTNGIVNFTKAKLGINATANGNVGQVVNITLNLTNLANSTYLVNGLFNVSVGGVNYTNVNFVDGLANISYQVTAVGSLNVSIGGNDYYSSNNASVVVNLSKAKLGINITVPSGSVGQVVNVTLNLTNLANSTYSVNGLFNLSVGGVNYTNVNFINGLANISYQVTAVGSSLNVSVGGNDYYSSNNASVVVNLSKAKLGINITVPSGSVGQVVNVTLNLTNLANSSYPVNGLFNVSVGGVNYTNVSFVNGLANVSYQVTAVGSSLNVSVGGNDYYNPNNASVVVNFSKAKLGINITVPSGSVGQVVNVTLNLTNLANSSYPVNGLFNVSVGGVNYTNVSFVNGLANVSYQITAVGSSLNVSVGGNDYYNPNNTSLIVNFTKAKLGIGAVVPSGSVGQVVNVTLSLINLANSTYSVNGLFNVSVGGVNYTNVNFVNGLANVSYQITAVGSSLNVSVGGNDYYGSSNTDGTVNFTKAKLGIGAVVPSGSVGQVVNVSLSLTNLANSSYLVNGLFNVSVGGVNYTNVNFVDGLANISYQITSSGSSLNVIVGGNDYYSSNDTEGTVNFSKAKLGIGAVVPSGSVGQVVNVSLSLINLANSSYLVNGLFNISVGGVNYTNVNFVNGLANVFYQITALDSSLNIGTNGNNYYSSNDTNVVVNFTKANIGIGAVVPSGNVGQVVNITLNLTNLANSSYLVSGLFNVSVGGVNYTNVNFVNGLANLPYNIKDSISSLNVTVNANQLYNSNSTVLDVNFSKQNVSLNINVPSGSVDDVVNVTVDVLDKNGNPLINKTVEIIVNGKSLGEFISNSEGHIIIPVNLTNSTMNIEAKFSGDNQYDSSYKSISFNPTLRNSTITVNNVTILKGDTATLKAKITDTDTGKPIQGLFVKFYVGGKFVGTNKTDANGLSYFNYIPTKTGKVPQLLS
ncbi:beta strand repeat-containing protein [Methanobrevibacter filiformis]|uniref:Putative outer membrane protein pmp6 n=1 Tax=Methanobrevibacter filiformis TaxID=55758 RepID=A0A165ZE90_9EURY|nr:hypothetical protein [Methanobrevibacter filiformis]KZX10602.1 putative outer membrane protein pmp6 precursor [Methanobrevibacter filiformis]